MIPLPPSFEDRYYQLVKAIPKPLIDGMNDHKLALLGIKNLLQVRDSYFELLDAVQAVAKGESRHDAALWLIREGQKPYTKPVTLTEAQAKEMTRNHQP